MDLRLLVTPGPSIHHLSRPAAGLSRPAAGLSWPAAGLSWPVPRGSSRCADVLPFGCPPCVRKGTARMRIEAARPHRQPIRRLRWSAALTAALVLTGTALTGCSSDDGPERTVDAFVDGWLAGDVSTIGFITPAGQRLPATDVGEELAALVGDLSDTPPQLRRDGEADVTADIATSSLAVEWTLPGDVRWSYTTSIRLRQAADDGWQIIWDPAIVHEQLATGDRFQLNRLAPRRGPVLDGAGEPVVAPRDVVVIGVQPSEVVSPDALVDDLDAAFRAIRPTISPPIDLTDLPDRLDAAKPDAFVDVVTLRKEAYDQIADRIFELPETRFRSEQRDLAPTREFARALLGTVDPVQRQDMETHPGRYEIGDMVGHGGLQGGYEERLRGVPGYSVQIAGTAPDGTVSADEVLFSSDARPGDPLRTTLDVATQTAADAALAGQPRRSTLVAVRISDGALVAVANGPDGGTENLAFTAQVPPDPPSRWSARSGCSNPARSARTSPSTARRPPPSTAGPSPTPTASIWAGCRSGASSRNPATPRSPTSRPSWAPTGWPRRAGCSGWRASGGWESPRSPARSPPVVRRPSGPLPRSARAPRWSARWRWPGRRQRSPAASGGSRR